MLDKGDHRPFFPDPRTVPPRVACLTVTDLHAVLQVAADLGILGLEIRGMSLNLPVESWQFALTFGAHRAVLAVKIDNMDHPVLPTQTEESSNG